MEWSNDMVLTFLDYYGEEPVIWNASHPSHKKRNEVHDAWTRIGEKMGGEVSVVQLKKKKDSLMASVTHTFENRYIEIFCKLLTMFLNCITFEGIFFNNVIEQYRYSFLLVIPFGAGIFFQFLAHPVFKM
jgi:hypothetical protein